MSIYDMTNDTEGSLKITHKIFNEFSGEWSDSGAVTIVAPGAAYTLELVPGKLAAEYEEYRP